MLKNYNKNGTWIDTHCHLFEARYQAVKLDPQTIYETAIAHQAKYLINVGVDLKTSKIVIEQANKMPFCLPAIGIHPHEANNIHTKDIEQLKILLNDHRQKIVAIGEIGLDYHYFNATKINQLQLFRAQLEIAANNDLPVLLHVRKAFEDLRIVLNEFPHVKGILHCFSGTLNDAKWLLQKGFKISLSGILTFKAANDLKAIVTQLPLSAFVLETDAPYLAPQSKRGKINYPHYLLETAKLVAQLKHTTLEQVIKTTTKTAISILKLRTE